MKPYDNIRPQVSIKTRTMPNEIRSTETVFYRGNLFTIGDVYFGTHCNRKCVIRIVPSWNHPLLANSHYYFTPINTSTLNYRNDMYHDLKNLVLIGNYYDSSEYAMFSYNNN